MGFPQGGNVVLMNGRPFYSGPSNDSLTTSSKTMKITGISSEVSHILPTEAEMSVTRTLYRFYTDRWDKFVYSWQWIPVNYTYYRLVYRSQRFYGNSSKVDQTLTVYYIEWNSSFGKQRSKTVVLPWGTSIPERQVMPTTWTTVTSTSRATLTSLAFTAKITPSEIFRRTLSMRKAVAVNDSSSFGKLTSSCAQSLKVFDSQLALYLRDLTTVWSSAVSIWKGLTSLTLKGLSVAYLSFRYGLSLTAKDTEELLFKTRSLCIGTKGWITSRARDSETVSWRTYSGFSVETLTTYNMKLYVNNYPEWLIQGINRLMVADFFPTLELAWDMIPFSFVADWFINIGDLLEVIDGGTLLSTFKILSCVYSRRSTCSVAVSEMFPELSGVIGGDLQIVYYNRFVNQRPPQPVLEFSTPQTFTHWVEGAALIMQRL